MLAQALRRSHDEESDSGVVPGIFISRNFCQFFSAPGGGVVTSPYSSANQRPVFRSRDQSGPIRGQYPGSVVTSPISSHSFLAIIISVGDAKNARARG